MQRREVLAAIAALAAGGKAAAETTEADPQSITAIGVGGFHRGFPDPKIIYAKARKFLDLTFTSGFVAKSTTSEDSESSEGSEATETSETSETTEGATEESESSEATETSETSEDSEGSESSENSENTEAQSIVQYYGDILAADLVPTEWGSVVRLIEPIQNIQLVRSTQKK